MISSLRNSLNKFLPNKVTTKNILKLSFGISGAQFITFISAPLLTRLYEPQSFGNFAIFTSAISFLVVLSSFGFDLAISIPEHDIERDDLFRLSIFFSFTNAILCLFLTFIFNLYFYDLFNLSIEKYIFYLLPFGLFFRGLIRSYSFYTVRNNNISSLAKMRFIQSLSVFVSSIIIYREGEFGLIFAALIGQIVALLIFSKTIFMLIKEFRLSRIRRLVRIAKKYSRFGFYGAPSEILYAFINEFPNIIFGIYFGLDSLGLFTVSKRIVTLPAQAIGNSIGKIFFGKAAKRFREGKLETLINKIIIRLSIIGSTLTTIIVFIVCPFLPKILGENWSEVSRVIFLIIPLFLGHLLINPINMTFLAAGKPKYQFISQIIFSIIIMLPLILSVFYGNDFWNTLKVYSVCLIIGYLFYFYRIKRVIKKTKTKNNDVL